MGEALMTIKKEFDAQGAQRLANYKANASIFKAKALCVMGADGNGTLDRAEVVMFLTPGTPQYYRLLVALELITMEELQTSMNIDGMVAKFHTFFLTGMVTVGIGLLGFCVMAVL